MSASMSGVKIADECQAAFKEMQLRHQISSIMYKIENKKTIVIDTQNDKSKSYEQFVASLPMKEPRYCLVDVDYTTKSGAEHSKMVFIFWCPDDCGVKDKMLYASSKDTIKKALQGIQLEIQATEKSEVEKGPIQENLRR